MVSAAFQSVIFPDQGFNTTKDEPFWLYEKKRKELQVKNSPQLGGGHEPCECRFLNKLIRFLPQQLCEVLGFAHCLKVVTLFVVSDDRAVVTVVVMVVAILGMIGMTLLVAW